MSAVLFLFVVVIFTAAGLGLLVKRGQMLALALFAVLLGTSGTAFEHLLSRPKPVGLELFGAPEPVLVLHHTFEEGRAIYVLLQRDTPRLYSLPWSEETAQQLQDAVRAAEGQGTAVLMRFNRDAEIDEPQFYAIPQQQARPDKPPNPRP